MGEPSTNLGDVFAAPVASAPTTSAAEPSNGGANGHEPSSVGPSDFDRLVRGFELVATGAAVEAAATVETAAGAAAPAARLEDDSRLLTHQLNNSQVPISRPVDTGGGLGAAIDAALDKSDDAVATLGGGRGKVETEVFREVFRSFVDNAPVGMFRLSAQGRFTQANPALAALVGAKSPQDLIGAVASETVFVEADEYLRLTTRLESREPVREHQTMWRRADGSSAVVRLNLRRMVDAVGATAAYEGSVQDVTDQQRRENQLLSEIAEVRRMTERIAAPSAVSAGEAGAALRSGSGSAEVLSLTWRITDRLTKLADTLDTARQIVGDLLITLQSSDEIALPSAVPVGRTPKLAGPTIPTAAVPARPPAAQAIRAPARPATPSITPIVPPPAASPGSGSSEFIPTAAPGGGGAPRPRVPSRAPLTLTSPDGSSADLPVLDGEPADVLAPPERRTMKEQPSSSTLPTQNSHHPGWYDVNDIVRGNAPEIQRRAKAALAGRNFQVKLRTRLRATTPVRTSPQEVADILNQLVTSAVRAMSGPGTVTLNTATVAKGTLIAVTDDRSVLAVTDKERIFDAKFPPADERIKVLRACRLAMSRHGGKVGVLSEPNVGTTVTMRFPRPKALE